MNNGSSKRSEISSKVSTKFTSSEKCQDGTNVDLVTTNHRYRSAPSTSAGTNDPDVLQILEKESPSGSSLTLRKNNALTEKVAPTSTNKPLTICDTLKFKKKSPDLAKGLPHPETSEIKETKGTNARKKQCSDVQSEEGTNKSQDGPIKKKMSKSTSLKYKTVKTKKNSSNKNSSKNRSPKSKSSQKKLTK